MLTFVLILIIIALAVALTTISVEKRALNRNTKHVKSSSKQTGDINHFKITFTFGFAMDLPKCTKKAPDPVSDDTVYLDDRHLRSYDHSKSVADDGPFDNDFDNEHYGFTKSDDDGDYT